MKKPKRYVTLRYVTLSFYIDIFSFQSSSGNQGVSEKLSNLSNTIINKLCCIPLRNTICGVYGD